MKIVISLLFLFIILGLGFAAMISNVFTDYSEMKDLQIPEASDFTIIKNIKLNSKVFSTPQVYQDIVYVQTASKVLAIDLEAQSIIWERRINGYDPNHALLATDSIIFTPSDHSNILALDSITGDTLWETKDIESKSMLWDITYQGNKVFIAFQNHKLETRQISTGELLWSIEEPSRGQIDLLPVNEDILLLSSSNGLSALNSQTGEVIWNRQVKQEEFSYIKEKKLIIALERIDKNLIVSGIDPYTGTLLWSSPISSIRVKCLTTDGVSVFISGGGLMRFDIDSKKVVWVSTLVDNLVCPILNDAKIYVNKNGRDMYIFDKDRGSLDSRLKLLWLLFSNTDIDPVLYEKYLIVATKRNSISIFRINSVD